MKTRWYIENLIDLEYFLHVNDKQGTALNQKKEDSEDREIFLRNIQPHLSKTKPYSRRFIIKSWLDQRKKIEKGAAGRETILPGEAFDEAFRILKYGLFIFGSIVGIGLAFSLLSYTGTTTFMLILFSLFLRSPIKLTW